jgi:hypothetical protein
VPAGCCTKCRNAPVATRYVRCQITQSYVWKLRLGHECVSKMPGSTDLPSFRGPGRAHIIIRQEKEYVRFRWRGSHAAHVCGGVQEQQYHQLRQHHQRVTPRRARAHRSSFGALRPILEIDYSICLSSRGKMPQQRQDPQPSQLSAAQSSMHWQAGKAPSHQDTAKLSVSVTRNATGI